MKRKPDLMWILVMIFGLGIVTTSYAQSLWDRSATDDLIIPYDTQSMLAPHTNPDQ